MQKYLLIGLLLFSVSIAAQPAKKRKALLISDSILRSKAGDSLFQYFSLSKMSYYTYKTRHEQLKLKVFSSKRKLPKAFESLHLYFEFNYLPIKGVAGLISLTFDNALKIIYPPGRDTFRLDFIPGFLLNNRSPRFVPADSVLTIAKSRFRENGFEMSAPHLYFDVLSRKYLYTVTNRFTKTLDQGISFIQGMEIIEIDALTGKLKKIGYFP